MSTNLEPNDAPAPTPAGPRRRVRLAVAGAVAGLALIGGAGVAYAAVERPVETGYATVVDEEPGAATAQGDRSDCPDGQAGGSGGSSGERGSTAPSSPQTPTDPTPDETPGDL